MPGELREAAVDLLRVVAVGMVVLGHWLASSVVYRAGRFEHENVLGGVSWVPWLSLVFQVMPVLFLVGGYANGVSWTRHRAGGGEWSTWLHRRAVRLLVPTTVYVGASVLAVAACLAAGMDRASLQLGAWAVAIHLWFLPVYLGVVAATPAMHAAHRRWGMAVPAVLAIAAAGTNALAVLGIPLIGWANYALVWGAVHQVGFAWQDRTFARHKLLLPAMVAGGVIALVGLVRLGHFQLSMVPGTVGAGIQNTSPPSVALLAYAATQSGLLIAIAPALTRWVRQPRRWRTVGRVNRVVMTIYLWHMAPVVVVALLFYPAGWWPQPRFGSTGWWEWRVAWIAVLTVIFVPLIIAVGRVERAAAWPRFWAQGRAHSLRGRLLLAAGITSTAVGLSWFTAGGFAPGGHFPVLALAAYTTGILLISASRQAGSVER